VALVDAAATGDLEAFAQLYDRHFPAINDFLSRLLRDRHEAADVSQDTFVRALERLPQLEKHESFRSWLFSIAYRLGLNRIEQRGRSTVVEPAAISADDAVFVSVDRDRLDDPAQAAEAEETAALVWNVARGLDDRTFAVLDLHVRQGLPSSEIADVLGVTKGNASTQVSRMKRRFADSVGAYLLARRGTRDCEKLGALLEGVALTPMTAEVKKMVNDHVKDCEICQRTRRGLLAPTAVLGALAAVPVSPALVAQGRENLTSGEPPTWYRPATSAVTAAEAAPGPFAKLLRSKAALVAAVLLTAAGALAFGVRALGGGADGGDSEATVLGAQITAPAPTSPASAGVAPTDTTSPPVNAGSGPATTNSPTTTAPSSTTTSSTTTSSTTTPSTTTPVASGGGNPPPATTTTTTTTQPSSTTTSTTTTSTTTTTTTTLPVATDPGDVNSTSHQVNVGTAANVVTVVWTPVAGALGYSIEWSQAAPVLPDQIADLPGGASQAVSPPLVPGNWFFNLRTLGPGGDWTATVQRGPYVIIIPPRPPEISAMGAEPQQVFELDLKGGECFAGPSLTTVTATVVDPDNDLATVTLLWSIDGVLIGSQPMSYDAVSHQATTSLAFPAGTVDPQDKQAVVSIVVIAEDATGLMGDSSLDVGSVLLTLLPCRG
jgi:RNA polymerase sigma factor (sigma-70 family)